MPRSSTTYVKGQSGNPRGRPKPTGDAAEVRKLARLHGPAVIQRLAEFAGVTSHPPAENQVVQLAAMRELLDRGYGRARIAEEDAIEGKQRIILEYRWADETPLVEPERAIDAPALEAEARTDGDVAWDSAADQQT